MSGPKAGVFGQSSKMSCSIHPSSFSQNLIAWQKASGRRHLPWLQTHDPYKRWLAEIMLQQTQVVTVIPYYEKFLASFPTVEVLAAAGEEAVLSLWSGLGYYSRARNLHQCARTVVSNFGGAFPLEEKALETLPGIGPSTAAAVFSAVTDQPALVFDGNVRRVISRFCGIGSDESGQGLLYRGKGKAPEALGTPFEKTLKSKARALLPSKEGRAYSQGMMDLGATVCTTSNPKCAICPVSCDCVSFALGLQTVLPPKKKQPAVKSLSVPLALYLDGNKVLLVRKTEGFWRGLWTLPEEKPESVSLELEEIPHRLTHLQLFLHPRIGRGHPGYERGRWVGLPELDAVGMPAPVKKLVKEILADPQIFASDA